MRHSVVLMPVSIVVSIILLKSKGSACLGIGRARFFEDRPDQLLTIELQNNEKKMTKRNPAAFLSVVTLLFFGAPAHAEGSLTISELANGSMTQSYFQKMLGTRHLPAWVKRGGTDSPSREIMIGSKKYLVLTSCKPHDCASESVAMLFSPKTREMSVVLSKYDAASENQTLTWFNVPDELSIDGKTVLFAALSGSLENHPKDFSFH